MMSEARLLNINKKILASLRVTNLFLDNPFILNLDI